MSQAPFGDTVKRIGQYFEGRSLRQQEKSGREAKTESSYYSSTKKRPAKLLGQRERKQTARDRAEYGQLKQLIGETQRSDLGVKINDTLTKYYESVVQDFTTKKTEAQQRKEITELNLPYEMRSQETKAKYGNTPSKYVEWYTQENLNDPNVFGSFSKPSWATWSNPTDELKRQQEFIDSYNKSIEKYTGFFNEESLAAQAKYAKDLASAEEQRQKTLGMLQTKLDKVDIAKKVNVTEETTTKLKPSLPADRVRRTSTLTPKVDQPSMFEDRPL